MEPGDASPDIEAETEPPRSGDAEPIDIDSRARVAAAML